MYRVVKNLPLADTDAIIYSGMLNLVGAEGYSGKVIYEGMEDVLRLPETYVHLYGKTETKPGRKMGHVTILGKDKHDLVRKAHQVKRTLKVIS